MANDSSRSSVPAIIANNVGMLFIISSQFFFASMGISVKMLNSLEPPVHALEVGCFSIFEPRMNLCITGYCSQDGVANSFYARLHSS